MDEMKANDQLCRIQDLLTGAMALLDGAYRGEEVEPMEAQGAAFAVARAHEALTEILDANPSLHFKQERAA
jgi:hypothetical protein